MRTLKFYSLRTFKYNGILSCSHHAVHDILTRYLFYNSKFETLDTPPPFPCWLRRQRICLQCGRHRFDPWVKKIPESKRSPGEGNGNPFQYSCLGNSMDGGAWQVTVHGIARVGHALMTKPPLDVSCGIWDLVPWWGIEPGPPALKLWSLSCWTTREVPGQGLFIDFFSFYWFS